MLKCNVNVLKNLLILGAVSGVVFFYGIGSCGLFDNNEGLYAQIAREMFLSRDYIMPTLNSGLYIEKPPLLYWMIALSFEVFGVSEGSARLVPALAGFLSVMSLYYGMSKIESPRHGFYAALILSTSMGFIIFSHMIFFDVLLTFFLTLSLLFYYRWWQGQNRFMLLCFYVFLALAFLTKGGVALVLVGLTLLVFWGVERGDAARVIKTFDYLGLFVFILLAAPWHILAAAREPQFLHFYFINEHIYRFLDKRLPRDYYRGPVYYYFHRLALYLLPWFPLLSLLWNQPKNTARSRQFLKFLVCWIFIFLAFFSISKAKANYYVVTILPPIALYLACVVVNVENAKHRGWTLRVFHGTAIIIPLMLCGALLYALLSKPMDLNSVQAIPVFNMLSAMLLMLAASLITFKFYRHVVRAWMIVIALHALLLTVLAQHTLNAYEGYVSSKAVALALPRDVEQVFFFRDYEKMSSVRFYLNQTVKIIDSLSNDLAFAAQQKDALHFISLKDFLSDTQSKACVFVFHEQRDAFESTVKNFKRVRIGKESTLSKPYKTLLYCRHKVESIKRFETIPEVE